MPLEQRVIAPIYVSRGCFNLDPGHGSNQISPNIPNELECVTNGTLANIIRQLSTLSRYAEDLFGSLLVDTSALVQRSVSLKSRLDVLSEKVERLDASDSGAVPGQNGSGQTGTISRKPFRSRADNFDQQVVARTTIPLSLREVYEKCDEPPPLDKLNPFRDDNMNGLKLYTNPNYFFELWRKEMLADRSRNKVAKKGDNVHMSGGKSKRTKASILRHQNSINSESQMSNTASPHHPAAAATAAAHYHMHHMTSRGSISSNEIPPGYPGNGAGPPGPVYNENGVLVGQPGQPTAAQVYQQQKIYGQVGMGQPQQIYGYAHQDSLVAMKREEPNPSGVGFHTVIEGYSVDPNNYQHHYVQHQYAPGAGPQGQVLGQGQSRPNSLELSHQQQQQQDGYQNQQQGYAPPPPPPPNQMDYYQQQQQNYAQQQNRGSYPMGQPIYGTQGQYPSPNGSQMTPTRRAAQLSRPSAPPPAPPGSGPNSAANSAPSTPKKLNGGGDMMVAVSGHPQLVSRDSLPPPPPPPNGGSMMGQHHQQNQPQHHQYPHPHGGHEDSVLPPPPPPPPPPMSGGGMMGNTTSMNGAQNDVCSPPPPPPPPMNGLLNSSSTAQFAKSSNPNSTSQNGPSTNTSNGTSGKPTAEMLQAVKLRPTQQNTNGGSNGSDHVDARSNLLAAIRHGIKLKRVEESRAREVEKSVPLHDVASILARRVAMELSDSEGEAEEEDADDSDAWDDESEC